MNVETIDSDLVQRSFSELSQYEHDLRHEIGRYEQLLEERQQEIHRENGQFR